MRIVQVATDAREHYKNWGQLIPSFGAAPEALLQGLQKLPDIEVHVVSCTQQPMQAPEKLSANTWFHLLHVPKIGWLRTGYQGCVRAIRKKLREIQPDIVHGQGTERECALASVYSGFPNVITIHGNMRRVARTMNARIGSFFWCAAMLERFALSRTMGVFCNSAYTQSIVQQLARSTWRVPNAIRREFFDAPLPEKPKTEKPLLLNIGAISIHKRQLEVIEVAEKLHTEGHLFKIQFIGAVDAADPYSQAFLRRIASAESAGFASYVASQTVTDLITTFDRASALIHAPSEEAFGLVVAEALARNLKVFATNVGGIPDILTEAEGAELFPIDGSTAMVSAISRWLSDGCKTPASAAAEMRRRYHPEIVAQQHVHIYKEILSRSQASQRQ